MNRAYYFAVIAEFRAASTDEILGRMARHNEFDLVEGQRNAWLEQISILKRALESHRGSIYLEFVIPRMGRRIDAVVIIGPILLVIEFKVYKNEFEVHDLDQVVDYALDLHNFHEGSHRLHIAPVLACTAAPPEAEFIPGTLPADGLFGPSKVNGDGLCRAITQLLRLVPADEIAIDIWEGSGYRPTPTIIEATLALYRGHSVADIARSDAGAENLNRTSQSVAQIIETSRARSEKAICFVTGVPGAGKTLVGLDAATRHIDDKDELYSVFLSGNGPLVEILQEALARDKVSRSLEQGRKIRKGEALSTVKAFIQNVHHFRDECLKTTKAPVEHVAIFDEAQRAWTAKKTSGFMQRKKGMADFHPIRARVSHLLS